MPILRNAASVAVFFTGMLGAADPRLVALAMPDATVIAGANVTQAEASPFGQYVLTLIAPHGQELQALTAATGFDPRKDITELLAVTNGGPASGLVLARGAFPVEAISAAAGAAGASTETYNGATILKSPNGAQALVFLDATLVAFGDPASVKAAIDRQLPDAQHLSAAVVSRIEQLSGANDAWVLTTVSPAGLRLPSAAPAVPGMIVQALQQVQQASLAVKLDANVTVAAQAQLDTSQNATALAGVLQLVANMAQMQAQKAPEAAAFAKSVSVAASGSTVTIAFSMPEAQMQQLAAPRSHAAGHSSLWNGQQRH